MAAYENNLAYFEGKELTYTSRVDVTLVVGGIEFPCHSSIVENHSPVIHTLFEIARENGQLTSNPKELPRITLFPREDGSDDISPALMEQYLCFIYRPSTQLKEKSMALQLLELAELLQSDDVKQICDSALAKMAAQDGVSWERNGNHWERGYWELAVKHKMPRVGAQFLSSFLKDVMLRASALNEVTLDHAAQHALLTEFSKLNVINYVREQRPNYQPDVAAIETTLRRAWHDDK